MRARACVCNCTQVHSCKHNLIMCVCVCVCVCVRVLACRIETERWRYLTTAIELFGLSTFSLSFAICYLLICCAIIIVVKSVIYMNVDLVTQWVECLGW